MKNLALFAFLSGLCGCFGYQIPIAGDGWDGPTNPQPGQDQATIIVWNTTFGCALGSVPPPMLWHFNDNCQDAAGGHGPKWGTPGAFPAPHGSGCLNGYYQPDGWYAPSEFEAANRVDDEWHGSFHAYQTFAHEFCHAFKAYTTGDADDGHTSDCFSTPGHPFSTNNEIAAPGSLVDLANTALIDAGF